MTSTEFIIYGLALWRICSLLVNEAGPFLIFRWVREHFGITHYDNGAIAKIPDNVFAQALSCLWCASLWISFMFIPFYGFAAALALGAFAIFVDVAIKRLQQ